jgi:RES domain-containing protein
LLKIECPDNSIEELDDDPGRDHELARGMGDAWLARNSSLALKAPSVVAPHSWNYLVNPGIAAARILSAQHWPFDPRLLAD